MSDNSIQVLWIDDALDIDTCQRIAEDENIELHHFTCWEDAKIELENNFEKWEAIILDAKCKYLKDDADKAGKFLMNVTNELKDIEHNKNRKILSYVLSAQGEDVINDLIPVNFNPLDNDWYQKTGRRFYSKIGMIKWGTEDIYEYEALFKRIRSHVTNYPSSFQIEHYIYKDVFDALNRLNLNQSKNVGDYLIHLLEPIHFGEISNTDYNKYYVELRKAVEHIYRHMVDNKILPPCIINNTGQKDQVNLSNGSLFLGAEKEDPSKDLWKQVSRKKGSILPRQLADWLKAAVFQAGSTVHTSKMPAEKSMNHDEYLRSVNNSPYMLRSLVMGLCDFILWYDNFLKSQTPEEKLWELKEVEN